MSVKVRLTATFLLIVTMVLSGLGLAVYNVTRESLLHEIDQSVRDRAQLLAATATPPDDQTTPRLPDLDMFNSPDTFVEILDPSGEVLGVSGNLGQARLPFDLDAIRHDRIDDVIVGGRTLMLYGRPIESGSQLRGYVLVARSPAVVYLALMRLRDVLVPWAALALLVAGLSSWLLVRRAIRPLSRVAAGAEQIRLQGNHDRRLDYTGSKDEIGRLAETIDAMLDSLDEAHKRLRTASAAQRVFLADASHELRRPLTIALSALDVLDRVGGDDPEFAATTLHDLHTELTRMARIVTQLLAMARSDSGKQIEYEPVLVADTVREAVAQVQAGDASPAVGRVDLGSIEDSVVRGSREELVQVFLNLLDNAVKYTPPEGSVSISGAQAPGRTVIRVRDTGTGISPTDLPRVFDRFYRADPAQGQDGAGLGLAIVDQLVREHGGRVEVQTQLGQGSEFSVHLPMQVGEGSSALGVRVIIPCLDEEQAIGPLVAGLRGRLDPARDRIIVVDNGSCDNTAAVAAEAGAEVVSEPRRGYGRACQAGLQAAGDGIAVFMDGDGADDPEGLDRILAPLLEDDADLVVGARTDPDPGAMTTLQRAGNRLSCALLGRLYGGQVSDLGPLRAIRVDRLLALEPASATYGWSTEMTAKALRARYRYREVPVSYRRRVGVSKVSGTLSGSLRAGCRILWTVVRWLAWRHVR